METSMRSALVPILLLAACAGPPGQSRPADPGNFSGQGTAGLDEAIRIANLRIIPLEIVEDSRCPADVQCVWAGRLVARVQIQSPDFATRTEAMELGRGIALEDARSLTLSAVEPERRQGEGPPPGSYRLTFTLGPGD